jgi:hypothetical protein
MSTTSSCSSSAPSRSSAGPGATPVFRSLSSRARTSPSPSEPEGHRRRARPHTPPRALLRVGSRRGGASESPPPPCSHPASLDALGEPPTSSMQWQGLGFPPAPT